MVSINPFDLIQEAIERMEARFMQRLDEVLPSMHPHHQITSNDDLINADQVAALLGCKKTTVLRYARNNVIPSYKAGKVYNFKKSEVTAALSSQASVPKNKKGFTK
jgi:excisionase family DNA binding protein